MRKLFWWLTRDKEGLERMADAREESRAIVERITSQTEEAKSHAERMREIRQRNHLVEIFDDAFRMGRE